MSKRCWLLVLIPLVALSAAVPAQAQVVHRVHAGGPDICDFLGEPPGCNANFSLVAIEFSDGRVMGQYTDRLESGDGFHAVIDCVNVVGNEAWVSGVITHGTVGGVDLAGFPVGTRVRDNGTSQNDPADEISFSFIFDPTSCLQEPDYALMAVPQGQVVVD